MAEYYEPQDTSDLDLGRPLEELTRTLMDAISARAGLVAVWHTERGQVQPPVGSGLPKGQLAELGDLLTAVAPDLLGIMLGTRPSVARVGALPGWQIDAVSREARTLTRWGRLHVLVVPVEPGGDGRLAALIGFVHPASRLDLSARRPHLVRLFVHHVNLVLRLRALTDRLLNEARWLEVVLDHVSDGLVLVDADGRVLTANPACERITGWPARDLYGHDLVAVLQARPMHWAGNGNGDDLWAGPLAGEGDAAPGPNAGPAPIELALIGRHGNEIYTEARVAQVVDDGGDLLGAVVSLRDVTAQREAEELQATFLSVISHELQTPLSVIRGFAELLADGVESMPPAQVRRKLEIVADESERLSKMVENLLDASRIGAGGLELTREPVNIPLLVHQAVQKMEPLSARHHIVVAVPDDLPPVLADYARVEQVVINLLENAIKYSPSGGEITITSDLTSDEVILHISDEGIGVPEAERERIFSRFGRLNSRVVRQLKGVGLGLYIARAIITAHGGRIWVDPAPGGGAQFSFSLPRQYKAPLPVLFGRR
jgi:signal transduction histidine kinase